MKKRRDQFIIFFSGVFIAVILSGTAAFLYIRFFYDFNAVHAMQAAPATPQINCQKVMIAAKQIKKGESITGDMLKCEQRDMSTLPLNCILDIKAVEGMRAAVSLDTNVIITEAMIMKPADYFKPDERMDDFELQGGLVAGTVNDGDYVDLEYVRATGETFTVLSKKQVKKKLENRIIIQINEIERKYINFAYAEQRACGGKIKTVLYLDPDQTESKVDYTPPASLVINGKPTGIQSMQDANIKAGNGTSQTVVNTNASGGTQATPGTQNVSGVSGSAVIPVPQAVPQVVPQTVPAANAGEGTASNAIKPVQGGRPR